MHYDCLDFLRSIPFLILLFCSLLLVLICDVEKKSTKCFVTFSLVDVSFSFKVERRIQKQLKLLYYCIYWGLLPIETTGPVRILSSNENNNYSYKNTIIVIMIRKTVGFGFHD